MVGGREQLPNELLERTADALNIAAPRPNPPLAITAWPLAEPRLYRWPKINADLRCKFNHCSTAFF